MMSLSTSHCAQNCPRLDKFELSRDRPRYVPAGAAVTDLRRGLRAIIYAAAVAAVIAQALSDRSRSQELGNEELDKKDGHGHRPGQDEM
jgi:hypothetical protein